jgi:lysophospholipase L1-like esterase
MVATILSTEIGLRLFAAAVVGPDMLAYGAGLSRTTIHTDAGTYRKFMPHQIRFDRDDNGRLFVTRMNADGFRGRSVTRPKPRGLVRVVTLGASSTFGYRNRDEDTYPFALEQALRADKKGARFDVVNLGIPHLDSGEIYALFAAEALPLNPDVVTFYEGANDSRRQDDLLPLRNGFLALSDRVLLASALNGALSEHLDVLSYSPVGIASEADRAAAAFLENVSRIGAECRRRGIVFVVANQQMKSLTIAATQMRGVTYADEERHVRRRMNESGRLTYTAKHFLIHSVIVSRLKTWALSNGVPFVDVIAALDARRDYLLSWVHLHPEANRIIARELATTITRALPMKDGDGQ